MQDRAIEQLALIGRNENDRGRFDQDPGADGSARVDAAALPRVMTDFEAIVRERPQCIMRE